MADFSDDCTRAMRRLVAGPQTTPKWVLDKTWDLNASRSKRITLGLCLDRKLNICIVIENTAGLGVKLTTEELQHLLSPPWRNSVLEHCANPTHPGPISAQGTMQFQCVILRNGEPGLRLCRGECFVILGEVTCKVLYYAAPAILQRLDLLASVWQQCGKWVVRAMESIRTEARLLGSDCLDKERDVYSVLTSLGGKLAADRQMPTMLDIEAELFSDMLFRHKEPIARMYIDYMKHGCDDDDDDA